MSIEQKKMELRSRLEDARSIAAKAEQQGRDFTHDERVLVKANMERAKALKSEIAGLEGDQDLIKAVQDFGRRADIPVEGAERKTWGAKVLNEGGFKALAAPGTLLPTTLDEDVIPDARQARFVSDLVPVKRLEGTSLYAYMRQGTRTNNAAVVAAGEVKPTSVYGVERIEDAIQVVAHLSELQSKFDLSDASYLSDFLESEMRHGLELAIEDAILNGDGRATPLISGIFDDPGIKTQAWDTDLLTTSRRSVTQLHADGITPDAFVLAPGDAERFDLLKDANGRYYFRGPSETNGDNSPLWSVPIVTSPAVPAGTGLMGSFKDSARIYTDGNVAIDVDAATGFDTNEVRLRCETRANVAVIRPFGFVSVTLTAPTA